MGVALATAAPAPRGGRATAKVASGESTARMVYREDAKGSAAHSVRDRLTALLAKPLRLWGA